MAADITAMLGMVYGLIIINPFDLADELRLLRLALLSTLGESAMVWLFYVALEPYLRRFWPQCIISWTRLIGGRLRDPLIGRHLLIGALVGAGMACMVRLDTILPEMFGRPVQTQLRDESATMSYLGGRHAVAACLDCVRRSVYESVAFALVLVLLRMRLRRRILAVAAAALIVSALYVPRGGDPILSWFTVGAGVVLPCFWLTTREGLLATASAGVVVRLLMSMPVSLSLRLWCADVTILALACVAGIALSGFALVARWRPAA